MAKEPQPGCTKTRLSPPLSHQEAADLYEAFLLDTILKLANLEWADMAVAISPPESSSFFKRITPTGTLLLPIEGADIGDCLAEALERLLDIGYRKVIAINADGPSLPGEYIHQAVELLDNHDVVFGESQDGGYYLVGVKRIHQVLFQEISWSTTNVLAQSLAKADVFGLSTALTPTWYDIDTIQDLKRLKDELPGLPPEHLLHTRRFLADFDLGEVSSD
jgi:rSAM/selenodomain-associated transferase 1